MEHESADLPRDSSRSDLIQWNALAICIPTYKRNQSLENLLAALLEQEIAISDAPKISILVIDNNPDRSAQASVEKFVGKRPDFQVRYYHEARPGVVHVRNSALEHAGDVDAVAFIDDDELPAEGWISGLWTAWRETGASLVWGRVIARYPEGTPGWMLRGDFHSGPIPGNVADHDGAGTNNCLLSLARVRALGLSFDPSLTLIGGEDIMLFDAMVQQGEPAFGTDNAVTYEIVPIERTSLSWLRARWRRTGLTDAILYSRGAKGWNRPIALVQGIVRMVLASPVIVFTWVISGFRVTTSLARRFYTFERGRGMIKHALGKSIEEYGRTT